MTSATDLKALGAIVRGCVIAVFAAAGLALALLAGGLRPGTVLSLYVLAVASVGCMGAMMTVAARRHPSESRFEALLEGTGHAPQLRPPGLVRAERDLMLAQSYGDYYDAHLRPLLAEIISTRARWTESTGSELAEAKLGPRLSELVRRDGYLGAPHTLGLTLSELTAIVDALEVF